MKGTLAYQKRIQKDIAGPQFPGLLRYYKQYFLLSNKKEDRRPKTEDRRATDDPRSTTDAETRRRSPRHRSSVVGLPSAVVFLTVIIDIGASLKYLCAELKFNSDTSGSAVTDRTCPRSWVRDLAEVSKLPLMRLARADRVAPMSSAASSVGTLPNWF
jgi:hypothetical protein